MINFDIDQAVNDINTGAFAGEQPQLDGQPTAEAPQINQPSFDPNLNIPYKANGREITEPLSTVIQRASMGYNYAQLMQQYKQQQAELEAQKQQIAQQSEKWRQYDEYANQNPEWANHVRGEWEKRFASSQSQQSSSFDQFGSQSSQQQQSQLPPEISRELAEMRSFVNQYKEEQHQRMVAEQDAALAQEIQGVQSEHPTIDLSATDPSTGESLESQILQHAQANGISSFRAAFRDLMFDRILAEKQTAAKESVAKQMQQQVKQGFLGQSDSPMSQSQPQLNLSRHSYHSLVDMAIKDLGLT
jgi:hypothetical protein